MKVIKKFDLDPDYRNYSVIYYFFSGENKFLFEKIESAIKQNNLTAKLCEDLYKRFFEIGDKKELEEIYNKIKEIIIDTLEEIKKTNSNVIKRNSSIGEYITRLNSKNIPIEEISNILKEAISELINFRKDCSSFSESLTKGTNEIEKLKKKIEELQEKAEIDSLTGLFNRRTFDEKIEELVKNKENYPISLIYVDLDDFKKINDTYGHLIGDEVLKFVAKKLKNNAKNQDIVARIGGEEFVLLLPNTSLQNAARFADNLRKIISQKDLLIKGSHKKIGKITASFGVSQYIEGESIKEFIARADKALYSSKLKGKNQVSIEN